VLLQIPSPQKQSAGHTNVFSSKAQIPSPQKQSVGHRRELSIWPVQILSPHTKQSAGQRAKFSSTAQVPSPQKQSVGQLAVVSSPSQRLSPQVAPR